MERGASCSSPAAPRQLLGEELPDEVMALVCSFLDARGLGRLACVARRFTERTTLLAGGLSPIEDGARRVAARLLPTVLLWQADAERRAGEPHLWFLSRIERVASLDRTLRRGRSIDELTVVRKPPSSSSPCPVADRRATPRWAGGGRRGRVRSPLLRNN